MRALKIKLTKVLVQSTIHSILVIMLDLVVRLIIEQGRHENKIIPIAALIVLLGFLIMILIGAILTFFKEGEDFLKKLDVTEIPEVLKFYFIPLSSVPGFVSTYFRTLKTLIK